MLLLLGNVDDLYIQLLVPHAVNLAQKVLQHQLCVFELLGDVVAVNVDIFLLFVGLKKLVLNSAQRQAHLI